MTKLPDLALRDALFLDIACALFVHGIYKHYEPNASLMLVHFLLLIVIPCLPTSSLIPHVHGSIEIAILLAYSLFYLTLVASIVIYRISPWHPLAKYPGPFLGKISKFWNAYHMATGKNHLLMKRLHEKYGSYVRIGPNQLSIIDASMIPDILGANGMPKGPMYAGETIEGETPSLITIHSFHEHAKRRRRWNRAFNSASVKGYEPIIQKRALQLVDELEKRTMKDGVFSLCLSDWLSYFTTDFMGDMVFGGGFELMKDDGDKEGLWTLLEKGMFIESVLQHIPWIFPLLPKIPFLNKEGEKIGEFRKKRVLERKTNGSLTKDLFHYLIDEDQLEPVPPSEKEVLSDGVLAIIAGSDTTSTTLSGLFYYLLSNPVDYKRIQDEIDMVFPPGEGDPFDTTKLAEMPFLNAVINESLRLQPPLMTSLQRAPEKGSGGKWINGHFISEGTAVIVPPYVLFRNPAYFYPAPDMFWPERWLHGNDVNRSPHPMTTSLTNLDVKSGYEVITNTAAFIPFSYGPANCAGRALALVEMRMLVALIVQRFEFQFAEDYDPADWEKHLEDHFVLKKGSLKVKLTPRM